MGCGYHEGGEPHKITVRVGNNERRNYSLYDFEDSTVWISSLNFKQDKIKFYFKRSSPTLTSLIFFAGDQSSIVNWKRYSRPKIIAVYINDKHWTDLHFEDCTCRQEFEFAPIYISKRDFILSFVIKEIYKGEDERVAISDIDFDGPGA